MKKKAASLLLALCALLFLAGCLNQQNVNELLRAPAMAPGQSEIQNALTEYLSNEKPQYKYPLEGDWRSPLVLADLDADGQDEAILFYSVPSGSTANQDRGSNAYIAVLEKQDGAWRVAWDEEGAHTDIASVAWADFFGDGGRQLVVGYTTGNLNVKTLVLYEYRDQALRATRYPDRYSAYLLGDFTGRGGVDLAVVARPEETGGLSLNFVTGQNGRFEQQQKTPVELDKNITVCVGLHPGRGPEGEHLLVVDGRMGGDLLVSQIAVYSAKGEGFYPRADWLEIVAETARSSMLLTSRDIDGDGIVEIPVDAPIVTLAGDKKLFHVEWKDFSGEEPVLKEYGILDADRSAYIRLPEEWRGSISVTDGTASGEWQVQRSQTGMRLLSVRTYAEGATVPMGAQLIPGSARAYLLVPDNVPAYERNRIKMTYLG